MKRLILTSSKEGDIVADLMCGSGSTVVAAANLGRVGWGCDINENLLDIWNENVKA